MKTLKSAIGYKIEDRYFEEGDIVEIGQLIDDTNCLDEILESCSVGCNYEYEDSIGRKNYDIVIIRFDIVELKEPKFQTLVEITVFEY